MAALLTPIEAARYQEGKMDFSEIFHELHTLQVQRWELSKNLDSDQGLIVFSRPLGSDLHGTSLPPGISLREFSEISIRKEREV